MTSRVQSDKPAVQQAITVDPNDPARARGVTSIRGLFTVAVSLVGLAFVVWIMFAHPKYSSLFGPAPGTRVVASAAHVPPPRPIPG
jgi:hypothetical protein